MRWLTEITAWEPPHRFIDRQVRGPYRLWVHEHTFEERDGGTVVGDRVNYAVPGGPLEPLVHRLVVGADMARVFAYRRDQMSRRCAPAPACRPQWPGTHPIREFPIPIPKRFRGAGCLRLGLCCLFVAEPEVQFRTATARVMGKLSPDEARRRLFDLAAANAAALGRAVAACRRLGIRAFRVGSRLLPLATHPAFLYGVDDLPEGTLSLFHKAGADAAAASLRLSFHPDQFVLLGSPQEGVTEALLARFGTARPAGGIDRGRRDQPARRRRLWRQGRGARPGGAQLAAPPRPRRGHG